MTETTPLPAPSHTPKGTRPLRFLLGLIVMSIASVGMCTWQVAGHIEQIHSVAHQQMEMDSLANTTLYHHEMMTSTAQMFCLNTLPAWKDRYEVAQRDLGQDLIDIRLMTPETFSPLNAVLEEASGELGQIEAECFRLMQAGERLQGLNLLASPSYLKAKEHFGDSLTTLQQDLDDAANDQEQRLHNGLAWWEWTLAGVLATLLLLWLACLRILWAWQKRVKMAALQEHTMERRLNEQGRMLNKIIENLPVGLFVKSVPDDYRWDIWNHKAEELFELPAAKVLGTSDFAHFPEHEARFFREIDEKVMREGRVIDVPTEEVTSQRGTWLAHTIKVPIYDDDGRPCWLLGIIEDITVKKQQADLQLQRHAEELEAANARLQEAQMETETADNAKAAILETMDGELRRPLQAIAEAADTLLRSELTPAQGVQVRTLRQAAGLVLHTLNTIADMRDEATEAMARLRRERKMV